MWKNYAVFVEKVGGVCGKFFWGCGKSVEKFQKPVEKITQICGKIPKTFFYKNVKFVKNILTNFARNVKNVTKI
ncbi:MAG: hypothetical protein RMJ51_01000 [Candidatus Calescibacterium sp.]|nr:hypothetical protein [Candidatus Calescibacterium sp.]MCX7972122.1 hypothetical protein [bacterium]MDW8194810.1 hypothetical protein [Candidatus Calescibacterium sp.]